ncbi:MAG: hypothetical protein HC765_04750 [Brachymonas sp.]|nr:hypothetical protein [Brachymonas sp.]
MCMEAQLLREARLYASRHPRRVISANCENYPNLRWLYQYALWVRRQRAFTKQFTYERVRYAIVWIGRRMCVMHVKTGCLLVGEPGE